MPTPALSAPSTATSRLRQWARRSDNQLLLLLLGLSFFPLLFELGRNPVQLWDESRIAVSSAYMALHGHWLVPQFNKAPDHWNTKPPLLIWLQAGLMELFGFSTWVLRLPTALATMATVVVIYQFAARVLRQPLGGFLGGLVLITSMGYVKIHVARTGDYDALLTLWETVSWVAFFQYLETGRARYLYWLGGALTAAVLTKSAAGLLGVPGLLLYVLLRGKLGWLLRQPRFYAVAALSLAVIVGYFLVRERADPGYWEVVKYNDISGRYLENQGQNGGDVWYFYLLNMHVQTFSYWQWLAAPAILLGLTRTSGVAWRGVLLVLCFAFGWMAVVSASASRHDWYDAPLYPALALLLGLGLAVFYQDLLGLYLPRLTRWQGLALRVLLLVGLVAVPYRAIIDKIIAERHTDYYNGPDGYQAAYLSTLPHYQPQLLDFTALYHEGYHVPIDYYQMVYEPQGRRVTLWDARQARQLPAGTVVTLCDAADRARLDSTYRLTTLHEDLPCQTVLLSKK